MPRGRYGFEMGRPGSRYDAYSTGFRGAERGRRGERPWVGGYREGFQGGSEGIPVGRPPRREPEAGMREAFERRRPDEGSRTGYDEGWGTRQSDEAYRRFNARTRPRYSPIGGMHPAMGGEFVYGGGQHRGAGYGGWYNRRTRWF
jgi:hypothetical protein